MSTHIKAERLKEDFRKTLENTTNKKFLIEREINAVEKFLYEKPRKAGALKLPVYDFNSVFKPFELSAVTHYPFTEIFDLFILNEKPELPEEKKFEHYQKSTIKEAEQLADYFYYLKSCLNEEVSSVSKRKAVLSHKEKLLALHYLGLDLSKFDNKKTAKILSEVIGHSEENTRKYLSYLTAGKNDVRTPKTLKNTLNLFESQGFDEISKTIKADLEKITK